MKAFPHDENSEVALLGSIIIDGGRIIEQLSRILEAHDFYKEVHQKLFSTMLEMHTREVPIDVVTLADRLRSEDRLGYLDDVGGVFYLTRLQELTPTSVNFEYYARIVKEFSNKRKLIETLTKITSGIQEGKLELDKAKEQLLELEPVQNQGSKLLPVSAKDLGEDFEPV